MQKLLTYEELKLMRQAGKVASLFLKKLKKRIRPHTSTKSIEEFFEKFIKHYPEMSAAFRGYKNYPASLCVSINEEIIHGIPTSSKIIKDGSLVSVDLGIKYKGLFVDVAYTYKVGKISTLAKKLRQVSLKALYEGIKKARVGARVGDISCAIQKVVESNRFSVIRKFVGHGIGKDLHLPPEVPNFGKSDEGEKLTEGLVLAIEPMVSAGTFDVDILCDGWTAKTKDNSLSAHFEHTVAITKKGPWIITQ
ncbi:MAG: type I methionyl aminopeptidase [Candidatus Omnitrophota bacterium]|nr:MAG: type I methionyl aminopeptidase [Candidatus Omnitrophota bacterium]